MMILDHGPVHSDPRVLGGTLVFRDTRVMARTMPDYLVAGDSPELFLEHLPTVRREDAVESLNSLVKTILLDDNLPAALRHHLAEFDCRHLAVPRLYG